MFFYVISLDDLTTKISITKNPDRRFKTYRTILGNHFTVNLCVRTDKARQLERSMKKMLSPFRAGGYSS